MRRMKDPESLMTVSAISVVKRAQIGLKLGSFAGTGVRMRTCC